MHADKASTVFTATKDKHGNPIPHGDLGVDQRPTSLIQIAMNYNKARKREMEYRQSHEYKAVCLYL